MSTLRVTEIQSNSTAFNTPVRFETSGGTENGQLAKVWVNFNGQGTVAIRADFNVNTISDRGTGRYTVNFSNALTNSSYAVSAEAQTQSATSSYWSYESWVSSVASGSVAVDFAGHDSLGTHYLDTSTYKVIVFR